MPGMSQEYHREYSRKHYTENKEKYIAKAKVAKEVYRQRILELKQGLSCKICGENHPAVLDFHHRDPSTKAFSIANAKGASTSLKRVVAEIAKCDVLCSNCHRKLHYDERAG